MKRYMTEFLRRGTAACGLGPLVLAVIYLILRQRNALDTIPVEQVCLGIFSLTALAFLAGGMNVVYQIERLPLTVAILLHGLVLYCGYLATYLFNGWIRWGSGPVLVFSAIFLLGYLAVWTVICCTTRRKTARLNAALQKRGK